MHVFEPAARPAPRTARATGGVFSAARADRDGVEKTAPAGASSPLAHDFARVTLHPARSALPRGGFALPESVGSRFIPEVPPGEFNEEQTGIGPSLPETEPPGGGPGTPGGADVAPAQPAQVPPAPAPAPAMAIRGPAEMWNFNGATPPNYTVSAQVSTNRTGGAFRWSVSPNLTLSSAVAAAPTVTTATPSVPPGRDARIAVRHTDAAGATTAASYRLTIRAPQSLTHLRNVDRAAAGLGYESEIHYSIADQFGTVLPRNLPLNEQFTGPAVADFPGGNWTRPPACGPTGVCGASFNPADWFDRVTGEGDAGAVPAPVAPAHPGAAVAAEHWPGHWFIGASPSGAGRRVRSVTWQRNRGFARHT